MISQGPSVCIFNKEDPGEVMASWLFTQYLLTNQVQTAYARTEGYVPVTSMAQDSAEYQDYLSRAGEDDDDFYKIKIQASRLLLSNTGNTFVTPVFNGSASLRDAAGQLIENVTKSVRRKETVDDAYMDRLFDDVASLYHLDEVRGPALWKDRSGSSALDRQGPHRRPYTFLGTDPSLGLPGYLGKREHKIIDFPVFSAIIGGWEILY